MSYQLFTYRKWLDGWFTAQTLITLGICLALGTLIEFFQHGINTQDIRNAPEGRPMDTGRVNTVWIFAMNLPWPRVIYIDGVRLMY